LLTEQLTEAVKNVQTRQTNMTEKFQEYSRTIEEFAKLKAEAFAKAEMLKGYTSGDQSKLIEELTAKRLQVME